MVIDGLVDQHHHPTVRSLGQSTLRHATILVPLKRREHGVFLDLLIFDLSGVAGSLPPFSTPTLAEFYAVTLIVTSTTYLAMWFFAYFVEMRVLQRHQIGSQLTAPSTPIQAHEQSNMPCSVAKLLRLIGPNAVSTLIRLSMSDHYIEAHTDTGMHLLYMRFADAIKDLETADSAQVHRSH